MCQTICFLKRRTNWSFRAGVRLTTAPNWGEIPKGLQAILGRVWFHLDTVQTQPDYGHVISLLLPVSIILR